MIHQEQVGKATQNHQEVVGVDVANREEYIDFTDRVKRNRGAKRCVMQALEDGRMLRDKGYETRLSTGKYYKNPNMQHRWVEYKKGNDWYVYDTNHKVTGWKKSKLGKMYVETDDPIYDFE